MAGTNRKALRPERTFAIGYSERHGLTPPVDVRTELAKIADLEEAELPGSADAIVLRRGQERARVILAPQSNANRTRFTLAHELGHLVLPWQVGSAFCHPHGTYVAAEHLQRELEKEANQFATELLVPTKWMTARLLESDGREPFASTMLDIANDAGVSPITAAIAYERVRLATGAIAIISPSRSEPYVVFGENCQLRKDFKWWKDPQAVISAGGSVSSIHFGAYQLFGLTFDPSVQVSTSQPAIPSTEILKDILQTIPASERDRVMRSVNGVIGAANPKGEGSLAELNARLRVRFLGRDTLHSVTSDPRFEEFVSAKATELHAKWTKP